MYYIEIGRGKKWKILGIIFSIFGIFAVFGTGNATQVNTIVASIDTALISFGVMEAGSTATLNLILGIGITVLVGMILLGGIKRIGSDIILVDVELAKVCVPRGRRDWP